MVSIGRKLIRDERGGTLVLVGLSLLLLLTVVGLVLDGGVLYVTKSHLQKAANAAVLSGAQELTGEQADVEAIIDRILQEHDALNSLAAEAIDMKSSVRITLREEVPLAFSQLFGQDTMTVEAEAAAQILPMGAASGAAPLGIDESIVLEFYKPYSLKVDNTEVESGYFGVLALGASGATTYEMNLKNGYPNEIGIGDIIDTQTGNIAGKTREGVQYRIDSDPYPPGDYSHRDSPRVLLIPVYRPYNQQSSQMKQIEVTGFAYFYILEPMSSHDTTITGMFIERTGTGYTESGVVTKGAYAIKLIE